MELNNRQKQILQIVNATGQVRVSALSESLFFSEMTIRRDLHMMEKEGLLKRVHGGAVKNESDFQYPISYRIEINKEQKRNLASLSTKYLHDGQCIFFNSSSSLTYLLPYLQKYKDLTVITNSVYLLLHMAHMRITCFLTGGCYNEVEQSLSGRQAEEFLKGVYPDIAFLSCEALSDDGYVTDSDPDLAAIAGIAVKQSKRSILLMDPSKVGTISTYKICHTDQLTDVILL